MEGFSLLREKEQAEEHCMLNVIPAPLCPLLSALLG